MTLYCANADSILNIGFERGESHHQARTLQNFGILWWWLDIESIEMLQQVCRISNAVLEGIVGRGHIRYL